jgi:hypothetical protein
LLEREEIGSGSIPGFALLAARGKMSIDEAQRTPYAKEDRGPK